MSEQRRREIIDEVIDDVGRPEIGFDIRSRRNFVASAGGSGQSHWSSWHFFAFSYQRAFDVLWDASYASAPPLSIDHYPLLFEAVSKVCGDVHTDRTAADDAGRENKPPGE